MAGLYSLLLGHYLLKRDYRVRLTLATAGVVVAAATDISFACYQKLQHFGVVNSLVRLVLVRLDLVTGLI